MKYYLISFKYNQLSHYFAKSDRNIFGATLEYYVNQMSPIISYVDNHSIYLFLQENISNILLTLSEFIIECQEFDTIPTVYKDGQYPFDLALVPYPKL